VKIILSKIYALFTVAVKFCTILNVSNTYAN